MQEGEVLHLPPNSFLVYVRTGKSGWLHGFQNFKASKPPTV